MPVLAYRLCLWGISGTYSVPQSPPPSQKLPWCRFMKKPGQQQSVQLGPGTMRWAVYSLKARLEQADRDGVWGPPCCWALPLPFAPLSPSATATGRCIQGCAAHLQLASGCPACVQLGPASSHQPLCCSRDSPAWISEPWGAVS